MIAKATSPELKSAFEAHLGQTKNHVKRVEQVFQMHGAEPKPVDCPAIDGILEEADEVGGEIEDKRFWTLRLSPRRKRSSITR